jgi:hypothetical protein
VSEHRRCRFDPRRFRYAQPPTGGRGRHYSGAPSCASQNCDPNSRTSLWRSTDPQRSDTSPSPRPTTPTSDPQTTPSNTNVKSPTINSAPARPRTHSDDNLTCRSTSSDGPRAPSSRRYHDAAARDTRARYEGAPDRAIFARDGEAAGRTKGRSPPGRPGKPGRHLVSAVVVEPVHKAAPMLVSASSCRDGHAGCGAWRRTPRSRRRRTPRPPHRGRKARQRELAGDRAVPRGHQAAPGVPAHHCEIRPRLSAANVAMAWDAR